MSAMARVSTLGVPRPNLMRYSPVAGTTSAEADRKDSSAVGNRVSARLNDRRNAASMCLNDESVEEGDCKESL